MQRVAGQKLCGIARRMNFLRYLNKVKLIGTKNYRSGTIVLFTDVSRSVESGDEHFGSSNSE